MMPFIIWFAFWQGFVHPRPRANPVEVAERRAAFRLVVCN